MYYVFVVVSINYRGLCSSLHGLCKPFYFSGWPVIGNLLDLGANPHLSLTELAKKYGSIYRIYFSTDLCYVLNDYDSIKKAFSNDAFSGRIRGTIIDLFINNNGKVMTHFPKHKTLGAKGRGV